MSKFFVFEGPDGAGKSTILDNVYELLKKENYTITKTREPGGVEIAEQIRNIILDVKNVELDARTEALLYAASRRQHLIEKIIPAIKKEEIILCDRFLLSSLVYQGIARNIGVDEVLSINKFAIGEIVPDLTIYFDIQPEVGLQRIKHSRVKDRLDNESLEFHYLVNKGYRKLIDKIDNVHIIDASRSIEEITKDVYNLIKEVIL